MITPEKISTNNPFIDNLIYYLKYIIYNCTIKDEEEATQYETKESVNNGDILISCVEGTTSYDTFTNIPKEILKKYIPITSNIDLYVENIEILKSIINKRGYYEKQDLIYRLSELARQIYISHYKTMTDKTFDMHQWLNKNKQLYTRCNNKTATYNELFFQIPEYTKDKIITKYLTIDALNYYKRTTNSNQDYTIELACGNVYILNNICTILSKAKKSNAQYNLIPRKLSIVMSAVFAAHYNEVYQRANFKDKATIWSEFHISIKQRKLTNFHNDLRDIYIIYPKSELRKILYKYIKYEFHINKYNLLDNLDNFINYYKNILHKPESDINTLADDLWVAYIKNNNIYISIDIYNKCVNKSIDYFGLLPYIPKNTQKIILSVELDEILNIDVYSENKNALNIYLKSLPVKKMVELKEKINLDTREWYIDNYNELNNYYRAFIGKAPLDYNGNPCIDTLYTSYDEVTRTYIDLGDKFYRMLSNNGIAYTKEYWKDKDISSLNDYDITILYECGILDSYAEACGKSNNDIRYRYLKYLTNKLNPYQCRKAYGFQLIGLPPIDDYYIKKKFIEYYNINKDYCERVIYSDAYKYNSEYYDKFIILYIIFNTILDILADVTSIITNKELFDNRCIKYFFESFGIPYFEDVPLKYLRKMLKSVNLFMKYKSSNKNMIDILDIFQRSDIRINDYYLFKEYKKNSNGDYLFFNKSEISYDLGYLWIKHAGGTTLDSKGIRFLNLYDASKQVQNIYTKEVNITQEDGVDITTRFITDIKNVYIKDTRIVYNTDIYDNLDLDLLAILPKNNIIPNSKTQSTWRGTITDLERDNYVLTDIRVINILNITDIKDDIYCNPYLPGIYAIRPYNNKIPISKIQQAYVGTTKDLILEGNEIIKDIKVAEFIDYIGDNSYIAELSGLYGVLPDTRVLPPSSVHESYVGTTIDLMLDGNEIIRNIKIIDVLGSIDNRRMTGTISILRFCPFKIYSSFIQINDFIPLKDTEYYKNKKSPNELKFIKSPILEGVTKYKNNPEHILNYNDIVLNDEYNTWDSDRDHIELYNEIAEYDFNIERSKYISIETMSDLASQSFNTVYFYNMILSNIQYEELLTIKAPYINKDITFKFTDVICYLFALLYLYNKYEDTILYSPTQILSINSPLYIKGFNFLANIDSLYDELQSAGINIDDVLSYTTDDGSTITLKDFYTLNNSKYKENAFNYDVKITPNGNSSIIYGSDFRVFELLDIYIGDELRTYIHDAPTDIKIDEEIMECRDNIEVIDYPINEYTIAYDNNGEILFKYILALEDDKIHYHLYTVDDDESICYSLSSVDYLYDSSCTRVILKDNINKNDNSITIIFKENISNDNNINIEDNDNIWDENDWFYERNYNDNGIAAINKVGENAWYYSNKYKPDNTSTLFGIEYNKIYNNGFSIPFNTYTSNQDQLYHISFTINANFNTKLQIFNDADSSVKSYDDNIYELIKDTDINISQFVKINKNTSTNLLFISADNDSYPISLGNIITVKNITVNRVYEDINEEYYNKSIQTYDKLQKIFTTNSLLYNALIKLMNNEQDYNKYIVYKKLYDALMISKYSKEMFKIGYNKYASTYTEYLKYRNIALYNRLNNIKIADNNKYMIVNEFVEMLNCLNETLPFCIYKDLSAYFPGVSASYIKYYITSIVNWFKSWKVNIIGSNTLYKINNFDDINCKVKTMESLIPEKDIIRSTPLYAEDAISIRESINISETIEFDEEKYFDDLVKKLVERTLTSLTADDLYGLTNIGNCAFINCIRLTSIELPDSVTSIGGLAFENCRSLTSINIPNSVTSIGINAFCFCTSLSTVNISCVIPPTLGFDVFYKCDSLTSIIVPSGCGDIYKSTNRWSEYADKIIEAE